MAAGGMKMTNYTIRLEIDYELPAKSEDRVKLYGTMAPGECFLIDMEHDAVGALLEAAADIRVIGVGA